MTQPIPSSGKVTDYTLTAADLSVGDVVNDDQAYDQITVTTVHPYTGTPEDDQDADGHEPLVRFTGTRERAGDTVVRTWAAGDRITIHRNKDSK